MPSAGAEFFGTTGTRAPVAQAERRHHFTSTSPRESCSG